MELEMEMVAPKFATPARSKLFQPAIALEFFKPAGKAENFAPGKSVFVENEGAASLFSEGARMYLLLDGEVTLSVGNKTIGTVAKGEVFGELALVDQSPRVATAMAETDCTLLGINRIDFMNLVKTKPAFALSLLKALSERLRFMTSKHK